MANKKCKLCGGTDIDVDPAGGAAACTICGFVLEDSLIVSEVEFQENCHGGTDVIGHFVSSDSRGDAPHIGGRFHSGLGHESREKTLRQAKCAITSVAQKLRLSQYCIDTAHNFYKMALTRGLTKGLRNTHVFAACLYITCRVERTPYLLVDFSDVLQVCVYKLGHAYLWLSRTLCSNIPFMDPCLYILRFAHCLEFGEKTHEVSMTALRLVQRMKRDFIHFGRRPSGVCGAALLMAARMHNFSRTVGDIAKVVKVHESTIHRRLLEFGDTPSSMLTLDQFMTVDLPDEQDPPSFKKVCKKDEKLKEMMREENHRSNEHELQQQIARMLEERVSVRCKHKTGANEEAEAQNIIMRTTTNAALGHYIEEGDLGNSVNNGGLGPNIASMGLATAMDNASGGKEQSTSSAVQLAVEEENSLEGLDEDDINSYIMTDIEVKSKESLWNKVNVNYLEEQMEEEEQFAREKEEGQPEKKKSKFTRKSNKNGEIASTSGKATEGMLQSKKISTKINYEVLANLNAQDSMTRKENEKKPVSDMQGLRLIPRAPRTAPISQSKKTDGFLRSLRASKYLRQLKSSPTVLSHSSLKSSQSLLITPRSPAYSERTQSSTFSSHLATSSEDVSQPVPPKCVLAPEVDREVTEEEKEEEEEGEEEEEDTDESESNQVLSISQLLNQNRDDDTYGDDYYEDY